MSKFAVFDIDGTLIRWQLYHAVVDRLAKRNLIDPAIYEGVRAARMSWKKREDHGAFKVYEGVIIAAYESALPKLTVDQFNEIIEETATEYKEQVYSYTRDLIKQLKQEGYTLLAISGSHQELVEHVGRQYGFDDCVGTQYLQEQGRFTGQKIVASDDKAKALKTLVKKHDLSMKDSYGVGDSLGDAAMLELVEHPIAFNPDQKLFDAAQAHNWKIVIERKNVIYELRSQDDRYQLQ
jgi:HAD superfamily hydrolase (TIGR01490 family)